MHIQSESEEALREWLRNRGVDPIYPDPYWLEDKLRYERAKDEDAAKHKRKIARLERICRFATLASWATCAGAILVNALIVALAHGLFG